MPREIEEPTAGHVPTEQEAAQNPRMLAMSAIRVQRDDDDDGDVGQVVDTASDQLALQTEQSAAPRVLTDDLDKTMVRVKVDGVDQERSVADVIKSYQLETAARRRMDEATRLLEQARQQVATAPIPPASLDQSAQNQDTAAKPSNESLGAFVDTLFEGDRDKAVAALAGLGIAGRTDSPTLDLDQLEAQLTPRIRQQLIDDSALERFVKANADLAADPHLVSVTNGFIQAEVDDGKSYAEALEEGAKRTRDWLGKLGVAVAPPDPTPTASQPSKLERKASIDEVPALNRTANTTQAAPESPSQVIASMKKARGQG